jgi:ferric-dicitrate binding protein FerR (iron transport regulator)
VIDAPEKNVLAYKTKFFSFSNADLGSVVEALNDVYDKKIVISDNLKACTLTVSFNNEDISEIALIISETLGLEVKESDQQILLEGEGCE